MAKTKKKKLSMRDKIKQRAKNRESAGVPYLTVGKEEMYTFSKNQNLDFIPYTVKVTNHPEVDKGEIWYQRTFFTHRNVGPENKTIVCPSTIKKPCPICEHRAQLMKDPETDDDILIELRPKERELFNIVNRKKKNDGVMVLDVSVHLFGNKLDEEIREGDDDCADFADPDDGKYLQIRCKKKSWQGNTFFETTRIDFKDRKALSKKILKQAYDLDKILIIKSYDEIDDMYNVGAENTSDDTESDYNYSDLVDMDKEDLIELAEEEGIKLTKKQKKFNEEKLRDSIARKLNIDITEEDEEEEDYEDEETDCPYGHEFGIDTNEYDDCDECEEWEECQEANDDLDE